MAVYDPLNLPADAADLLDYRCTICGGMFVAEHLHIEHVGGRYMLVCEACYQRGLAFGEWETEGESAPMAPTVPALPEPAPVP